MKYEKFLLPLGLIVLWQLVSILEIVPRFKLPSPLEILVGLKELIQEGMPPGYLLHNHVLYSLYRVGLGYLAAVVLAIPLGLVLGWSEKVRGLVRPVIEIIRPIPPLAWIPIAILWFGIGLQAAAFIIFLGAFFPILLNTISGVRGVNPVYLDAARTLGTGEFSLIAKVLIPASLPMVLTGIRVGLGVGWMTLVAAELTGVRSGYGLGFMIMTARDLGRVDAILAGMAAIGLVGYLMDRTVLFLERKTLTTS